MKKRTKAKTNAGADVNVPAVALPRPDVTDAQLVDAIMEAAGLGSKVLDKFSMTLPDLLARMRASSAVSGAFAEAKLRMVDVVKARAFKVAIGDNQTPPDPTMIRWIIKCYE